MFGWFSKGKATIELPKYNFTQGETIKGVFRYSVKKPYHADKILVRLIAKEKRTTGFGKEKRTQYYTLVDTEVPILGETDLVSGQEYANEFEIGVPKVSGASTGNEAMNTIANVASMVTNSHATVYWTLQGRVSLPGFDLTKKVKLNVV